MPREYPRQARALAGLALACAAAGCAQTAASRALINQAVDEGRLITLAGNVRSDKIRYADLGPAESDLRLDMYLQLKRSPEREIAAQQFVESLTDRTSPNFHKWITAAEYGRRFGASPEDIATVSRWLESHGFTVNSVPANSMVIDFSGTAAQVSEALHTEIHTFDVASKRRFANVRDPRIPAALAPAVAGVVSLNNFGPHSMLVPRAQYTLSSTEAPLVPGDLATIYNLNAVFAGGYTGKGQTIVLVEDTDLYAGTADWKAFRQKFGLDRYADASLTQVHPTPASGGTACNDPGINEDLDEAAIDVEWATATAPDATIVMASCADSTNFGGFIALQNMLTNGGTLPSVVSISYGESEVETGAAFNAYINVLYQTAAAAGVSVFVSSGDDAAAASDRGSLAAVFGIGVSGWASTAYNVAVGGTDFSDLPDGTTATFWNSVNGKYFNSATSYVPEIPWNDSCTGSLAARFEGFGAGYGASGLCNADPNLANTIGGSGGPSACATGTRSSDFAVSGTCAGYAKPSWQTVFGNPSDGVRDLPDVSLFASNGFWGHYYVVCLSLDADCTSDPSTWPGYGGTSVSSPIMAAIQALINQALGVTNVGNPDPAYYEIARNEFGASGNAACNSSAGPDSTCSFNDVTRGDMAVACAGSIDCFLDGEVVGVLSTSSTSYEPAYAAAPGWDFATGLGSVNAFNLLISFVNSVAPSSLPTGAPVLLSPANGATGVSPEPDLSWQLTPGARSYDVYFGTASPPPLVANTMNFTYTPAALNPNTAYYWAVGARNSIGAVASAPWSFTTGCASALKSRGASVSAAGGAGTILVTSPAGCAWTAVSNASWIVIASGPSGAGDGTVEYSVASNMDASRTGTITVANQTFTISQASDAFLISTMAGGALPPTAAAGTSLSFSLGSGLAVDSSGNTYFTSSKLNAVFMANPAGVVTRIAGTGEPGYAGDAGPALSAQFYNPGGLAIDSAGNLYIADTVNNRIRKLDVSGNVITVAGNGGCCSPTGDGFPATSAQIGIVYALASDAAGDLYLSDNYNNVIRKVDTHGIITTVAGNGTPGYSGDGHAATSAQLNSPYGVAADAGGDLFIADAGNLRVRKVTAGGTISTVAGDGGCCYPGDGGQATSTELTYPQSVALDPWGRLYIADSGAARILKLNSSGTIATVAGNGSAGYSGDNGAATSAQLSSPTALAIDGSGNLYVADTDEARIRKVDAGGAIATLVGGAINDGGIAALGLLNQPAAVASDTIGNVYIADTFNHRVRKVTPSGSISTVAGTGESGFAGDGRAAVNAQLNSPQGVAADSAGDIYIADTGNERVRKVDTTGTITTLAGNGATGYSGDGGSATSATLWSPRGLALDSNGYVYIADTSNSAIRKVVGTTITTVAGNGLAGFSGDTGKATSAQLRYPRGVAVDSAGNMYIADTGNLRVRMVSKGGTITTVAGDGNCCGQLGDRGLATSADLAYPEGVAVDAYGNLYIADTDMAWIREVTPSGMTSTIAGIWGYAYSGDGGPATLASLWLPSAVAIGPDGTLLVADQGNNAVRMLTPANAQPVLTVRSAHAEFAPGQTGATFTLTVSNAVDAGPTSGLVTVNDIVPAAFPLVSMSGAGWTCQTPAGHVCTRSDALPAGASYPPVTVTVNVPPSARGQATNQASVVVGGISAATADLSIVGSNPIVSSSFPASAKAGARGFVLALHGAGFEKGGVVQWSLGATATTLDTRFINATEVTAVVGADQLAKAGVAQIVYTNPGGNSSEPFPFTVLAGRRP